MTDAEWQARVAELEAALRTAQEAATAADRAKAAFLANLTHEVRTPLNAVLGFSALLRSSELTPQQREWAGFIEGNGQALLSLLNDIIDLAKIDAGSLALSPTAFDLQHLVDEAAAALQPRAQAQGLLFGAAVAPEVQGEWIGDAQRLRQVLAAIGGNAVKFTERGSVTIEAGPAPAGAGTLAFAVCDTGIGIAPEVQRRLFSRFTQADESFTRKYGGTGLGLAISKALISLMGGNITIDSRPGAGTTVRFTVACERGGPAAEVRGARPAAPSGGEGAAGLRRPRHRFGRLRALIVEDEATNRRLLEHQLRQLGLAPEAVADGRAALERMQSKVFDVVFMDVEMPEMNGLETTRWLRAASDYATAPDVPVIALTAHAQEGDRARCLAAGMTEYLSKPTSLDVIEETLVRVLPDPGGVKV